MEPQPLLATVAILTYNGATYLREILTAVQAQRIDGDFDVLVIDSGSTDGTLDIVADFPEVRLHTIPNSEFGHGRTRGLAATLSRGEYTAYLTHDAVPTNDRWLAELLRPMRDDARVAGVCGRQTPRAHCFPLLKYEIQGVFAAQGPAIGVTTYEGAPDDGEGERRHKGFYSDVNSAARTALLTGPLPYRDVSYAEDQLLGRDIILNGWRKAYAGMAVVEHSNDLTLREYGMRMFDETVGVREAGFDSAPISRRHAWTRAAKSALADGVRISRDGSLSWRRKLWWLVVNPLYQARKWSSIRRALATPSGAEASGKLRSLESARRQAAQPHE